MDFSIGIQHLCAPYRTLSLGGHNILFAKKHQLKKLRVDSLAGLSMLDRFDSIHNVFAFVQSQYPVSITKNLLCTQMVR
jgi:hypothetical protein